MEKIDIIINKMGIIIQNIKVNKDLVFNIYNVKTFISLSVELIIAKLKELEIIKDNL